MAWIRWFLALFLLLAGSATAFIYSGMYPAAADVPHSAVTYWALETLRERSIKRASRTISVPDLTDPSLLLNGGADYNEMCAGCHLKPGVSQSDMSIGLYPSPPNLSLPPFLHRGGDQTDRDNQLARKQFWIIKHGIKASGMPAWGPTHDDQRIWAMVAFLQKLPALTTEQYQILTTRRKADVGHH